MTCDNCETIKPGHVMKVKKLRIRKPICSFCGKSIDLANLYSCIEEKKKVKTITEHIRDNLLLGLFHKSKPVLEELKKTEWNSEFETLMRNRLIMGALRYGLLKENISYDSITSIRQRLDLLEVDGNGEHLVDIANLCLVMFTRKDHPKFHFKAQDDAIHTEKNLS